MTGPKRGVLVVADSASQLAPACRLADAIAEGIADDAEYCPVHVVIPKSAAIPSQRQIQELSLRESPSVRSFQDLIDDPETLEFDVVVAMLPGTSLFKLRLGIERLFEKTGTSRRPLLITGYNGLVCTGAQEGLLWRLGYDLICVNSNRDYRLFKGMCLDVGMSPASLFVAGVLMTANGVHTPPPAEAEIGNLVFATQAVVPPRRVQRLYILDRLVDYANSHPKRQVIVKLRTVPGERTFHQENFAYPVLWAQRTRWRTTPSNLHFRSGALCDFLTRSDLLVSVSSTAVLEALSRGVRSCVLEDFGLREGLGTQIFAGSGLVVNFDDIIADRLPEPDPTWLADNGLDDGTLRCKVGTLVRDRLLELKAEPMSFRPCYFTKDRTPQVFGELSGELNGEWVWGLERCPKDWWLRVEGGLSRPLRKAKKLLRDPAQFAEDSTVFRTLRRVRTLKKEKEEASR